MLQRSKTEQKKDRYPLRGNDKDLISRVESHCIALKKKRSRERYFKGSGCNLKIFTGLNGMSRDEILKDLEHVGVVQTPINPNDKVSSVFCVFFSFFFFLLHTLINFNLQTKPAGFRTNATRIGGTVSLINTGGKDIYANMPVYWDCPGDSDTEEQKITTSECGEIKGHPEGIIYPATRMLDDEDDIDALVKADSEQDVRAILSKRRRVIGWSLNHAKPGEQLDLILKR